MPRLRQKLFIILSITLLALVVDIPKGFAPKINLFGRQIKINLSRPPLDSQRDFDIKKGLDLQGGMQVTLSADMSKIDIKDRPTALESVQTVISKRIDLYGVSESSVKTSVAGNTYRIVVELPGISNPGEALNLIGQTAKLEFATPVFGSDPASPSAEPKINGFLPTDLTGSDLLTASVTFESQDRTPAVKLQFKDSGKNKFAKLTKEYIQKPLAIMLDGQIISAPIVQNEIVNGDAVINGKFTTKDAKFLATQLNAGALPVPVSVVSQKNIPALLGVQSLQHSLIAGGIGLGIVILFMSIYYGWMGIIAAIGLVIYGLITLALYKLIPVTLTLPGIAGFILSVGMAVDSNVLIFERFKEELRAGRAWPVALELGFTRAWNSIRDANISTIMTGLVLFNPLNWNFLNVSGMVRGFAFTLVMGILVSLFTGIYVTRTLLRLFYRGPKVKNQTKTQ